MAPTGQQEGLRRRCETGRCDYCGTWLDQRTRRRRDAYQDRGLCRWRPYQHRLAPLTAGVAGRLGRERQARDCRADERQCAFRELGRPACASNPGSLVSRRRRRNCCRRSSSWRFLSSRPAAANVLQVSGSIASLRRLQHERAYIPLFHWRAALSIRIWLGIHQFRVHQPEFR